MRLVKIFSYHSNFPIDTKQSNEFQVEVVYASPTKQRLVTLTVEQGTTAVEAVRLSNIVKDFS